MTGISPKQKQISDRLKQYESNVKCSYLGTIHALTSEDYPDRLIHFSHSLREVIDLLTKKSKSSNDRTNSISSKIRIKYLKKTFDPLGDNHGFDECYRMLDCVYHELSSVSHHEKTLTNEQCDEKLTLVENILELLTQPISNVMDVVDEILSQTPSENNAKKLQEYLFSYTTQSHLVQKLSDEWLPFLRKTNFFNNPASIIKQDDRQKLAKYWMPSDYLRKCTTNFPSDVCDIILTCKFEHKSLRNWIIYSDFLECTVKLPFEYTKKIAEKIISEDWHDFVSMPGFAEKYANVMDVLYVNNEYELAKQFALNLWKPKIVACKVEPMFDEYLFEQSLSKIVTYKVEPMFDEYLFEQSLSKIVTYKVEPMFDEYLFEQSLSKIIPKFVKKNHTMVIELLITLINQSLAKSEKDLMRLIPSIEDHSQNTTFPDIVRFFVFHLRDCLNYVGENNIEKLELIMPLLSNEEYDIFRRIELYIYCQFPNEFINSIPKSLEINFNKKYVHEYYNLIKKTFELIPKESQQNIVNLIDKGVNKKRFERWVESSGKAKAMKYEERWKLEKFEPIYKHLDDKHKSEYGELLEKFGKPEHPDFDIFQKGITIGGSDTDSKSFYEKSVESVFKIVKNYKMAPNQISNEDSTLVSFEKFVEANCFECSEKCLELKNTSNSVLNSFFSGLEKAIKNNQNCMWENVLILAENVLEFVDRDDYVLKSFDPVNSMMYLINTGLRERNVPFEIKEKVWEIVKLVVTVCNRYSSNDEIDGYPDELIPDELILDELILDELILDDNSISGLSYRILCDYILWCFENNKERCIASEIKNIFNSYLNNTALHSVFRHKIIGEYFDSFHYLDKMWTEDLFSKLITSKELKIAFWKGFLVRSYPTKDSYAVLYDLYEEFSKTQIVLSNHPIHKKTVELIMLAFFNNVPKYDKLFPKFYNNADEESISSCGNYINFLINNKDKKESYADKIEYLWNVKKFQDYCNLELWFKNSPLTKEKSIKCLLNYVKNTNKKFDFIYFPLENLKEYITDFPIDVADCIIAFLEKLQINHVSDEPLYTLTQNLFALNNPDVNNKCKNIKNKMILFGHHKFRDL